MYQHGGHGGKRKQTKTCWLWPTFMTDIFSLNSFPAAGSTVSSALCHARGVVALGENPTSLRFGSVIFLKKVASQPVMTTAWDRCKAPRAARGGCLLAEL